MIRRCWAIMVLFFCGTLGGADAEPSPFPRDEASIRAIQSRLQSPIDHKALYMSSTASDANCAVPIDSLSLQKFWIADQPGGDLTTKRPQASRPATPERLAADLKSRFPNFARGQNKVVILVVDDFTTPLKVAQEPMTRGITHGELILNQLGRMISTLRLQDRVSVVKVPFKSGERMPSLERNIHDAIQAQATPGVQHFVVNMSFAQLSCRVLMDYQLWLKSQAASSSQRLTFQEYAAEVLTASASSFPLDQATGALMSPDFVQSTPVAFKSFTVGKDFKVVRVAAAGNYAQHFPLYPAAWPEVIGVSAAAEDYRSDAMAYLNTSATAVKWLPWSNWGDVTERGQWFRYDRSGKPALYYYGTSFATPIASLLMALTLTRDSATGCKIPDLYFAFASNGIPLRTALADRRCLE